MTNRDLESDSMGGDFRGQLSDGRRAMAHLIHVWHERNDWSHKVLPALADALGLGRVHSSQISNLRNGKLASPGPEVFLALAQTNMVLYKGIDSIEKLLGKVHPELLKVLVDSSKSLTGDDGKPLRAGELFEIFLGISPLPSCFDWFIDEQEAASLSEALADYLCRGKTWRQCSKNVMGAYPIHRTQRRDRFAQVMAGLKDYTAEQLDGELLDLHATNLALGDSSVHDAQGFLSELRFRANSKDS